MQPYRMCLRTDDAYPSLYTTYLRNTTLQIIFMTSWHAISVKVLRISVHFASNHHVPDPPTVRTLIFSLLLVSACLGNTKRDQRAQGRPDKPP